MKRKIERYYYVASDLFGSGIAWTLLYLFRKAFIETKRFGNAQPVYDFDNHFILAIIGIPLCWCIVFWLFGSYRNIYKKSRIRELGQSLIITFIGCVVIFFTLLLDDEVNSYSAYRETFFIYFFLQFGFLVTGRMIILGNLKYKLKNRIIGFNTLIVGSNHKAKSLYHELENAKYSQGYRFLGYVSIENGQDSEFSKELDWMGNYANLPSIISNQNIEEVILAVESSEHQFINNIISLIQNERVIIKVLPDMYDLITGSVKMNYIFGTALIEIMPEIMPPWQKNLKRVIDVIASVFILLVLSPFYLLIVIGVRRSSSGPIFYSQERIGKDGMPFRIYKFRTMFSDAEKMGPQLSSDDDPRITPFGKFLRKYRLDEFPQFYNVLIGDMSMVGPRPERQFFIDQIIKVAPHYKHLHRVKPGITSWGMIKFGYAENVEQMVERMKFDILYIENMSIAMDFKIFFYTVLIIIEGRGK